MPAHYDPFDPATRQDPFAAYAGLREAGPVEVQPGLWLVARHDDCASVLRDSRWSAALGQRARRRADPLPPSMLTTDPPEHTRLRRAVQPAFAPDRLAMIAARVTSTVERLTKRRRAGDTLDGVIDLARPVAEEAMAALFGLADDERAEFAAAAVATAPQLDPLVDGAARGLADRAVAEMSMWFADRLGERLGRPTDDVLGTIVRAHDTGLLTPGEAVTTCNLLVIGGFEPLADLVAGSLRLLLSERNDLGSVVARDWSAVVDECLRFDGPVHLAARAPVEDVVVGEQTVRAGHTVVALLGAANRDPDAFAHPDRFDPARQPAPHLAFGAGAHHCLGAAMVRRVTAAALLTLRAELPGLSIAAPWTQRDSLVPRGLAHLPLEIRRH